MLAFLVGHALLVDPPPPEPASSLPTTSTADAPGDPDTIPPTGRFWIVSGSVLAGSTVLWGGPFLITRGFSGTGGAAGPPTPEEQERADAMRVRGDIAIGINAGFLALGLGSIAYGAVQDHRFDRWRYDTGHRPPAAGEGLLGAGVGVLTSGIVFAGSTGPFFFYDSPREEAVFFGLVTGAYALAGTALTITGAVKRKRVHARLRSNYELAVHPISPGIFTFGLMRAAM